jgi:serine/threonine protein kinase
MDPKYLSHGTYGCVVRPAIGCNKRLDNNNVSKLFSKRSEMEIEVEEHSKINNSIDPTNIFTLKLKEKCSVESERIDYNELTKCKNLKTVEKDIPQIVYEYGGYDLLETPKHVDFEEIFIASKALFKGLVIMEQRNYAHLDIKPANIVYNRENKKLALIDFGLAQIVTGFYSHAGNKKMIKHPYAYYPPEFSVLTDYWSFDKRTFLDNNKNPYKINRTNSKKLLRNIYYLVRTPKTISNELNILLQSFELNHQNYMEELAAFFEYAATKTKLENVLNDFVNRIDVYMVGSTLLEILNACVYYKTTEITIKNCGFYIDVIKLLQNMVHISPAKRFTPQQCLNEYRRIMQNYPFEVNSNENKGRSKVRVEKRQIQTQTSPIVKAPKKHTKQIETQTSPIVKPRKRLTKQIETQTSPIVKPRKKHTKQIETQTSPIVKDRKKHTKQIETQTSPIVKPEKKRKEITRVKTPKKSVKVKRCREDQELNPKTNMCIKSCIEGYVRNEKNRCIKLCPEGYVRNERNRCVKETK